MSSNAGAEWIFAQKAKRRAATLEYMQRMRALEEWLEDSNSVEALREVRKEIAEFNGRRSASGRGTHRPG